MAQKLKSTPVKGGVICRDAKSGRFLSVTTPNGVSKASGVTAKTVGKIASKRSAALKRLADR